MKRLIVVLTLLAPFWIAGCGEHPQSTATAPPITSDTSTITAAPSAPPATPVTTAASPVTSPASVGTQTSGTNVVPKSIVKASVSFRTTSDDKDGDTQIRDRITCNGQDFFKLECCSAGKSDKDDHFNNGSDRTRNMTTVSSLDTAVLPSCTFVAGSTAKGTDNWVAVYVLELTLSDGSRMAYSLGQIPLLSVNSSLVEKPIKLASLSPTFP